MTSPRGVGFRFQSALLAVSGLLVVACADTSVAPTARNDDAGAAHAVGSPGNSAGSAAIEARALINVTGSVFLEVTTGRFDAGFGPVAASGRIEQIQLKIYNSAGKLVDVRNFNSLPSNTGYVKLALGALAKSNTVSVQANIRGIDGKRTDVVRSGVAVQWSPELNLDALPVLLFPSGATPDLVQLNTATDFQITFGNGGPDGNTPAEVGVRASCDVYVDGTKLDLPTQWVHVVGDPFITQPSVYIGPNDAWLCKFTYAFATIGPHEIKVVANALDPSEDYNPANNTSFSNVFVTTATPLKYAVNLEETAVLNVSSDRLVKNATLVALKLQAVTIKVTWDEPLTTAAVPTVIALKAETNGAVLDARSYNVTIEAVLPSCVGGGLPRRIGGPGSGEDPIPGSVFTRPYYENPPNISMCVQSQTGTSRAIQLTYSLSLADGLSGAGTKPALWPLSPFGSTYFGVPIIPFGETFAFTGSFQRTVNGTDLEFGDIKKCVGVLQPLETHDAGLYLRTTGQSAVIPGACP